MQSRKMTLIVIPERGVQISTTSNASHLNKTELEWLKSLFYKFITENNLFEGRREGSPEGSPCHYDMLKVRSVMTPAVRSLGVGSICLHQEAHRD